ncbi:type I secretion system permease/ATPase [Aquitalea palustris]|uniref:Cyclolysin secretion/processing ATP-binding protein CyaB n=1 Tax=Aquitalea palustris TaxID=2480983 RepID=A0A454JI08_9NEIS|nr:type I secretion system permease/ATPase [Aquitalea palustris]RMC97088.1 type I secretion system permease/ATPase [Aquitalea palustris]
MHSPSTEPQHSSIPLQATHLDPLLDCLFALARSYGINATRESLVAGIPLINNRLNPSMFSRSARRIGLTSRVVRQPLDKLREQLLPAVLLLHGDEACILRGIDRESGMARVSFAELTEAETSIPLADLAEKYAGLAIFVRPRFNFERRAPELGEIRSRHWFWQTVYGGLPLYRDSMIAALLINLFALVIPLVSMNVYDRVVPNMATETLWVLAIGGLLALIFDFLLKMTRAYLIDLASKRVDVTLSSLIMERVLGIRMEARPASVGAFSSNLRAFETVRDFIASASITALIDLPFVLIFLLAILWVSPLLTLPVVVGGVLMIVFALLIQEKMKELTEATLRASAQRNAQLVENLAGLETIKILAAEGQQQGRWEQGTLYLAQVGARLKLLATSANTFAGFITQLVSIVMLVLGVYQIMDGNTSQGGVIAAVMLSGRAMAPLGQLVGLLTQYHNAKTSLSSLDGFMKMPVEREQDANFFHRTSFQGEIEFRNVSFSYPDNPQVALRNVSFKIKAGERVAIIGRVGSGKTTLQKLILGLFRPTEGSVRVDGIDINQIDPAELRRHIGYVPQDSVLFYGTLRQNIAMGAPHAHDASIAAAAELAGLAEFINGHPQGFDMIIGERGDSLSGGQRKAVTIARALLNAPPILLMDEPTSNMDNSTENQIKQTLVKVMAGKTMIMVTHHNALLELADRLIVIDNGAIVADGEKAAVIQALQQGQVGRAN